MWLKNKIQTDVLVAGAGLAGIMAAISAARSGAKVTIVSSGPICSGSSFYTGTWGLGVVGPEDEADEQDLIDTVMRVGEGISDPILTAAFVRRIRGGIKTLEDLELKLKDAENKGEKEFIPCFDHKNREWHGLVKKDAGEVFLAKLEMLGVMMLPHTEIIQCVTERGRVSGVIAVDADGSLEYLSCKSLVLATGGLGGLFRHRLNTDDVTGIGQYMALMAGARLVNLEFMQMMPGYLSPAPKTIYNEKVFKYSSFQSTDGMVPVFGDWDSESLKKYMEIRSTHGPFTSRLESRVIDIRLFKEFLKDRRGVTVFYKDEIRENQPEFIHTYFEWLEKEKHLTVDDPIQLGIFAHASNGGIEIDAHGFCGIPGLFACGEVTGGMHGADRLGGLSTANGLVFGIAAGEAAAEDAKRSGCAAGEVWFSLERIPEALNCLEEIREMNFKHAMVIREESGLRASLKKLEELKKQIGMVCSTEVKEYDRKEMVTTYRLKSALCLSECLLNACLLRQESRGPHYRSDFPKSDKALARSIVSVYNKGIKTGFKT